MPLSIPAFVQYQAPMPPLRGLWNASPLEGDRFVNAELDWLSSPPGSAVQFQLAGSSPVAISQIVALAVDNAASGADVQFIFPDSGFVLSVPSRTSGVFPVFTNALMFYASAPSAIAGDRTVFQAFNSMPPPVPIPPSQAQNQAGLGSVSMNANSTTPLVPAGINGTLQSLTISASGIATGTGVANVFVRDGTGANLWTGSVLEPNGTLNLALTGLGLRFVNGLNFVIANSTLSSGFATVNAYYSTP